jgi:hypothetical protein
MHRTFVVSLAFAFALAGCGNGYTTQQATQTCDVEKQAKQTLTDAAYQECISCYESCGTSCNATADVPPHYACQ